MGTLHLDGRGLCPETLVQAAEAGWHVVPDAAGLSRMAASRALVDTAIAERRPVYGVTTGLGAKAGEVLDAEALATFSQQTLRGRAHALGTPLPDVVVRAAMIVRLNTFLGGHSGARPEVAQHLSEILNAGLVPVVGEIGSIGAGDLVLNATLGMALVGEGRMRGVDGIEAESATAMRTAGVVPLTLAPRDGLALANHASVSAARGAVVYVAAARMFDASQAAAALSLEGFQANLSPFDARVLAAKPLPGQQIAMDGLRVWLEGSALWAEGAGRRLQDPLSLRNIPQIHGGLAAALTAARETIRVELNGSSDNPVALVEDGEIVSCGNYHTTELALVLEGIARAVPHVAMAQVARFARLMDPQMTDLPKFLAQPGADSNGFAPVLKLVEDLAGGICHAATPAPVWPGINALGVEDAMTSVSTTIRGLTGIAGLQARLTAIELMIAAQAVALRGASDRLGPPLAGLLEQVRDHVAVLDSDRPLADEIEALAQGLTDGMVAKAP